MMGNSYWLMGYKYGHGIFALCGSYIKLNGMMTL